MVAEEARITDQEIELSVDFDIIVDIHGAPDPHR
jgi:hypothetical protein